MFSSERWPLVSSAYCEIMIAFLKHARIKLLTVFRWLVTLLVEMGHVVINVFNAKKKQHCKKPKKQKVVFGFAIGLPRLKKERTMPLEVTITNEQEVDLTLKPVTLAGKPAELDEPPVWSVVSGNSTITPAADGLLAVARSSDDPGDTIFMVKGDADLGEGVEEISDTITLHVAGARAASLGLAAGTPREKTPLPPPA